VPAAFCAGSADSLCFDAFRQEVFHGSPVSDLATVDSLNALHSRLKNLLYYLAATSPADGWNQFIVEDSVQWNKVAVGGHSQGAGHAAFCAKVNRVERVLMFSGPNDFSDFYNAPAHWISGISETDSENYFAFLHRLDEVVDYEKQYRNLLELGMISSTDTVKVEISSIPFNNSRCLYTALPAQPPLTGKYHGATVVDIRTPLAIGGVPVFDPVWSYMLTASISSGIARQKVLNHLEAFPNPTTGRIRFKDNFIPMEGFVITANGRYAGALPIRGNETDLSFLPSATYYLYLRSASGHWHHCKVVKE
jgi:hypothetical protein